MSVGTSASTTASPRRDWTRIATVSGPLLLIAAILLVSPNFRMVSGPDAEPFGGDVMHEWTGGWVLLHGDRDRLYDVDYVRGTEHDPAIVGFEWDHDGYLPMVYPPFWYVLAAPLALLPLPVAAVVWPLLMTGCLIGAAQVLRAVRWAGHRSPASRTWATSAEEQSVRRRSRVTHDREAGLPSPVPGFGLAVLASLAFAPLILSLGSGQKGTLLLLLFSATFLLLHRGCPFRAGLVFGLVAFKPHLTLVVGFTMLFKRQWAFLAGGITTGSLLVGISFLAGGDLCRDYFALCAGMGDYVHRGGYAHHEAHSWWGAMQLLLAGWPDGVVKGVSLLASVVTIACLARVNWQRFDARSPTFALQFSSMCVGTLLLSPHLYTYDLTLLLLPMALVGIVAADTPETLGHRGPFLLTTVVVLFAVSGVAPRIAETTGLQPTVLAMLAFLWIVSRVVSADERAEVTGPRPSTYAGNDDVSTIAQKPSVVIR